MIRPDLDEDYCKWLEDLSEDKMERLLYLAYKREITEKELF